MADILATADELATLMRDTGLDEDSATLALELVTGEIQGITLQRLVEVVDDEFVLMGTTDSWLTLPQRPVQSITSITIDDGDELVEGTDFKRFGARLWRRCGWADCVYEPSTVAGVYTPGWPTGHQALQPARAAALALVKSAYSNTNGLQSEAIDDYRVSWAAAIAVAVESAPHLARSLRRTYGSRAGLVRIG